jgi:O-antigen ligase
VAHIGRGGKRRGRAGDAPLRVDPLRKTLFLLTLLTVSRIHQHFGLVGALRPALLLALAALAYAVLNPRFLSRAPWFRTWPARSVMALGALACASAVFGISLGAAARFILEDYSKTLIFAFLLMATMRGARDIYLYTWAYVIASGILVWMSLFVFGLSKAGSVSRLSGLYTYDANDVGLVLLVGLGLCLITLHVANRLGKAVSLVIMLGIGVAIARTGSRGAFLGLLAFGVALLVFADSVSLVKRVAAMGATAIALTLASPEGYWAQMQTMLRPTEDYNWTESGGRKNVWKRGLEYMIRYPVFGVGVNGFGRAEGTISQRARDWQPALRGVKWIAPHNSYVQIGAEMGIPALAVWCSLAFGGIVAAWRIGRRIPRSWASGSKDQRIAFFASRYLPVSTSAFAVSSFFVSFAYMDPVYILASLLVGLIVVDPGPTKEGRTRTGTSGAGGLVGAQQRAGL